MHLHQVLLEHPMIIVKRTLVLPGLKVAEPPRVFPQRQDVFLKKFGRFTHEQGALAAVNVETAVTCRLVLDDRCLLLSGC